MEATHPAPRRRLSSPQRPDGPLNKRARLGNEQPVPTADHQIMPCEELRPHGIMYNGYHKLLICVSCRKVLQSNVINHMSTRHTIKILRSEMRTWDDALPTTPLQATNGMTAIEGVPVQDGLRCAANDCDYVCGTMSTMQKHRHDAGTPPYRTIRIQQPFLNTNACIEVTEPATWTHVASPATTWKVVADIYGDRARRVQQQEAVGSNLKESSPWLVLCGITDYASNRLTHDDLRRLRQSTDMPSKKKSSSPDDQLMAICRDAVERFFDTCCREFDHSADHALRTQIASDKCVCKSTSHHHALTPRREGEYETAFSIIENVGRYRDVWTRFTCFVLRAATKPLPPVRLTHSQLLSANQVLKLARESTAGERGTNDALLHLFASLIDQPTDVVPALECALVCFSFAATIDKISGCFGNPKDYTPTAAALAFSVRLFTMNIIRANVVSMRRDDATVSLIQAAKGPLTRIQIPHQYVFQTIRRSVLSDHSRTLSHARTQLPPDRPRRGRVHPSGRLCLLGRRQTGRVRLPRLPRPARGHPRTRCRPLRPAQQSFRRPDARRERGRVRFPDPHTRRRIQQR